MNACKARSWDNDMPSIIDVLSLRGLFANFILFLIYGFIMITYTAAQYDLAKSFPSSYSSATIGPVAILPFMVLLFVTLLFTAVYKVIEYKFRWKWGFLTKIICTLYESAASFGAISAGALIGIAAGLLMISHSQEANIIIKTAYLFSDVAGLCILVLAFLVLSMALFFDENNESKRAINAWIIAYSIVAVSVTVMFARRYPDVLVLIGFVALLVLMKRGHLILQALFN